MGLGVDVATGITLVFGTSGFTAELLDMTPPEGSREAIQTSHQGTTGQHTFTPADLVDWGELRIDFHFNPATEPPINEAVEELTLTWPDGDTWVFNGFMTNYSGGAVLNEKMTGSATIKVSGDVDQTAS